jgi:maltose alpha-D-glucosyltransferase/alpha-amylase
VAHYSRIAPFQGEISLNPSGGEKTTVAMLQGLIANGTDSWQWFLEQVAGLLTGNAARSKPPALSAPQFASESPRRSDIPDAARLSLEAAALLGRRTAEMHLALASSPDLPDFAPERIRPEDLSQDAQRIQTQLSSSLESLRQRLPALEDATFDAAALLLSKRRALIARSQALGLAAAGQRIRIHGDLHLGQTLCLVGDSGAAQDFIFLDFEGEPARPLEERRRKQSPLKDVAGMIRSFSYAAQAGLRQLLDAQSGAGEKRDADQLTAWAQSWQNLATAEFLSTYRKTIAAQDGLLPPPSQAQTLLDAYLLEKALYELMYELNHRPAWLQIPIAGILSLLAYDGSGA